MTDSINLSYIIHDLVPVVGETDHIPLLSEASTGYQTESEVRGWFILENAHLIFLFGKGDFNIIRYTRRG